jgi:hypothetical protein
VILDELKPPGLRGLRGFERERGRMKMRKVKKPNGGDPTWPPPALRIIFQK